MILTKTCFAGMQNLLWECSDGSRRPDGSYWEYGLETDVSSFLPLTSSEAVGKLAKNDSDWTCVRAAVRRRQ